MSGLPFPENFLVLPHLALVERLALA